MKPRDLHLINHALTGPSGPGPDLQAALDRLLQGMGLGLDISRMIVEQHQGRMECSSKVDRGTVMSIYLPSEQ